VASIFGAGLFPVFYLVTALLRGWRPFGPQSPLLIFATLMAALIVYKHRGNITRLRAGTENRFDRKVKAAKPSEPISSA
jgi:glycerol-3-phosphate acyltransferase PlsY